jgi:YVTN family beta-propeller protein
MKQREITKNNPHIQLGRGVGFLTGISILAVDPSTNKIYVANSGSNTVSIIDSDSGNVTNIPVGTYPSAIAVSPSTDKIYVANQFSNDVTVISASTDKVMSKIPVGRGPSDIIISSSNLRGGEKIYVTNFDSNDVSVINASTDKMISKIPVGRGPSDMVEYNIHTSAFYYPLKIYVANQQSNDVSVINASSDRDIGRIRIGTFPGGIMGVNTLYSAIYVANLYSNYVSVINASTDKVISKIPVGEEPDAVAVSPSGNKIYVTNFINNTVSVINASSDREITRIPVGEEPDAVAVSPSGNKIYVTDIRSNDVTVVNASTDKVISRIPVGEHASAIEASKVYPSISYVLKIPGNQTDPITISVIDDSVDKIATGITFNIHPANSGNVWCNNKQYPANQYLYVVSGTKCIARPAKGFEFSSWAENIGHNSTVPLNQSAISDSPWNSLLSTLGMKQNDTSATFDVNRFGTFTANFKAVPPTVPPEYWIPLYGIIVSTVVGWSIPSIIAWIRARGKRKQNLEEYDNIINSLSNATDRNSLDTLRNQVIRAFISEKINEFQYKILDEKISEYYKIINRTNSENGRTNNSTAQREYKRSPI